MRILTSPKRFRAKTRDGLTFDARGATPFDAAGNHRGMGLPHAAQYQFPTRDARGDVVGYRTRTYDSTGAFLVGELERLDQTLHLPLAAVTWGRDIDLREDVTMGDEVSSFTLSSFASAGALGAGNGIGNGKAWIGKNTNQVAGVSVDIGKTPHSLHLWGMELKYTIPELMSAAQMGRPIDEQKYQGLQLKYQMDVDEMVYVGDTSLSAGGLVNNAAVTNVQSLPNGTSGSAKWTRKTPDEILADVNFMLNNVWAASAYAVMPSKIGLPPAVFGYISTQKVSSAGNMSILKYILENNLLTTSRGAQLEIVAMKWLVGAGSGGTIGTTGTVDRAVVYTQDKNFIRYPLVPLQHTPVQYDSLYHKTTYFGRLGEMEVIYPETIGYFDGVDGA